MRESSPDAVAGAADRPFGRAWVLLAWALVMTMCAVVLATSRYSADMSAFLPRDPDARQRLLIDQIRDGALSRMVLIGIDGGSPGARADASRALAAAMRASPDFRGVVNGDEASRERDQTLLLENRYLLSPAVTPEHFSVAGLRQAIGHSVAELSGSAGMMLRALLPRDPTGELLRTLDVLSGQDARSHSEGAWASPDGQRAMLIAMTRASGTDTDAQERALTQLSQAFHRLNPDGALRLRLSGTPVFAVHARATIKSEVERLSLIGSVAVFVLLFSVYRSLRNVLIGLLPVASGIVVAIAAVSLGFGVVHAITIGFGTTLIGETIDYSIYYLMQARNGQAWRSRYWPTIRLGVATSVCGFAVLMFSSFPGLAQLGAYSVAGLVAAAFITRFVLPALPAAPVPQARVERLGVMAAHVADTMRRLRWPAAVLTVGAMVVVVQGHGRLWAEGLSGLNPAPMELQRLDAELRADAGAPDLLHMVVVSAPTQEAALRGAERVEQRLAPLLAQGVIDRIETPTRVLPSAATQAERRAALPPAEVLQERLAPALDGLPLRPARLAPFLEDVSQARQRPFLTPASLEGSSLGFMVSTLLLQRPDGWSVLMPLRLHDGQASGPQAARSGVAPLLAEPLPGAEAFYLNLQEQATSVFGRYLDEALWLTAIGGLAMTALLAFALRSPARVARVLLPLASAVALVMAAHVLLGARLTLLHLVGLLLIVGVGSNYALFFNQRVAPSGSSLDGAPMLEPTALASVALANITTLIGFGILGFSQVPVLHAIGATVGPGALLALLLAMAWSPRAATPMREPDER